MNKSSYSPTARPELPKRPHFWGKPRINRGKEGKNGENAERDFSLFFFFSLFPTSVVAALLFQIVSDGTEMSRPPGTLAPCVWVCQSCVCVCVILLYEAGPRANIKLASIFLSTRFKLWQTTRLDKPKWKEKQKRKNNILSTVLFPLVYFLKRYKTHILFFFLKNAQEHFYTAIQEFYLEKFVLFKFQFIEPLVEQSLKCI